MRAAGSRGILHRFLLHFFFLTCRAPLHGPSVFLCGTYACDTLELTLPFSAPSSLTTMRSSAAQAIEPLDFYRDAHAASLPDDRLNERGGDRLCHSQEELVRKASSICRRPAYVPHCRRCAARTNVECYARSARRVDSANLLSRCQTRSSDTAYEADQDSTICTRRRSHCRRRRRYS